jgi:membrane protease YdiL (CAAX protease family)
VGSAAVALGVASLLFGGASVKRLLRPTPRSLLVGAVVGAAMALASHIWFPLVARITPAVARETEILYSAFRAPAFAVASLALAPVILGEELVWRGVVQTAFVHRAGPRAGVALAVVTYGLAHAPIGSPLLVIVALLCGAVWSVLRATTASLIPSLAAHIIWDVIVLLWRPLDPP